MMLVNMVDSEGSCEPLNYVQPGHRIIATGTLTGRVMEPGKEKEDELKAQPLSAGFNNGLSAGANLCPCLKGGATTAILFCHYL